MQDNNLYKKNTVKEYYLKELKKEIEKSRKELNQKILSNRNEISKPEILQLSQKLDETIVKYLKVLQKINNT
ncbi:MAG: aspartyl-phosphate phosphatase Spo0E family protein [Epulopiscium sp.]|nr:aspartyl-phosphate phosphatase Spo0E family protein [Candidatus Epulonipiscium sp.]